MDDRWLTILRRALRFRCPRCGEGAIYRRALTYSEYDSCPACGLEFDPRGETVVFMYLSTAVLTGCMFIGLLLIPPVHLARYRVGLVATALALYLGTTPLRKSLAIALLYLESRP